MTKMHIEVYRLRSTGIVIDAEGNDVGRVGEMYLNEAGEPEWITIEDEQSEAVRLCVPLAQAHIDGNEIHLPYDHETLEGAPRFDVTTVLTPADETELRTYYGLTRDDEPPSGEGQ